MAFVTKCDICGEIYKSSKDPQSSRLRIDGHFLTDLENGHIDICPECTKKVFEFIDVLKTGHNYCIWVDDIKVLNKE